MQDQSNFEKQVFLDESFDSIEFNYETSNIEFFMPAIKNCDSSKVESSGNKLKTGVEGSGPAKSSSFVGPQGYFFSTPDTQNQEQANLDFTLNDTSAQTPIKKGNKGVPTFEDKCSVNRSSSSSIKNTKYHQNSSSEENDQTDSSKYYTPLFKLKDSFLFLNDYLQVIV